MFGWLRSPKCWRPASSVFWRGSPAENLRATEKVRSTLCQRLQLDAPPVVKGLLIVDSPQPMNFHMLERSEDAESVYLDAIGGFTF